MMYKNPFTQASVESCLAYIQYFELLDILFSLRSHLQPNWRCSFSHLLPLLLPARWMAHFGSTTYGFSFFWPLACWRWPASKPAEASWRGISHWSTCLAATPSSFYVLSPSLLASRYQPQSPQRWSASSGLRSAEMVSLERSSSISLPYKRAPQSSACYLLRLEQLCRPSRLVYGVLRGWHSWFSFPGLASL